MISSQKTDLSMKYVSRYSVLRFSCGLMPRWDYIMHTFLTKLCSYLNLHALVLWQIELNQSWFPVGVWIIFSLGCINTDTNDGNQNRKTHLWCRGNRRKIIMIKTSASGGSLSTWFVFIECILAPINSRHSSF